MEHTAPLMIQVEKKLSDLNIAINPNDGSDLNLFTLKHNFIFYAGTSLEDFKSGSGQLGEGTLQLLNECPHGTLLVSEVIASRLAWTQKALLILDDRKMYLTYSDQLEF